MLIALCAAVLAVVIAARDVTSPASGKPDADPHGAPITVVIPKGADAAEISDILEQRGVIEDGGRFHDYADSKNEGSRFQAGTYTLRAGTGYDALLAQLDHGPSGHVKTLVIPEGYRLTQIEALLPSVGLRPKAYARAVRAAVPPAGFGHHVNMEGFMFPATYIDPAERDRGPARVTAALSVRECLGAGEHGLRASPSISPTTTCSPSPR